VPEGKPNQGLHGNNSKKFQHAENINLLYLPTIEMIKKSSCVVIISRIKELFD